MEPIDFNGLDSAVHGPTRLAILTLLTIDGAMDFSDLKKRLNVPDGALGAHLQKLEECGYIACRRRFVGKRPKTTYRLQRSGSEAFTRYLDTMARLIHAVEQTRDKQGSTG